MSAMKQLNRIKIVLVEHNKTAGYVLTDRGKEYLSNQLHH